MSLRPTHDIDRLVDTLCASYGVPAESWERVRAVIRKGAQPIPIYAAKTARALAHPEPRVSAVVDTIESDPTAAVQVLKLANAPVFGSAFFCGSLHTAVIRLGTSAIRDVVLTIALRGVYRDLYGQGRQILDHCVDVARICRAVDQLLGGKHPGMYMAGLMHDIGKLMLLQSDQWVAPSHRMVYQSDQAAAIERARRGFDHALISAVALRWWGVKGPAATVVALHHDLEAAFRRPGEVKDMVAILRVSEQLSHINEEGLIDLARLRADPCWRHLGLQPREQQTLIDLVASARASGTPEESLAS